MNKEHYEEISRIFYPKDDFKLPFTSREEMTREWIGRRIMEDRFPAAFPLKKYFELHQYLIDNDLIEQE